jgi:FkbH-like protein
VFEFRPAGEGVIRVGFIRNFTLESIELWLQRQLRPSGLSIECRFGGFAEAAPEIEQLGNACSDLTVLALGLEMTPAFRHVGWRAEDVCEQHLMLVRAAATRSRSPLVVNTVLPPLHSPTGLALVAGVDSHAAVVDRLNVELRQIAAADPGRIVLVDWGAIARELGERGTYDYRYWHTSGAPFAAQFLNSYAAAIASVIRSLSGKVRKCLVLDCDNTLWGGVVGEVGCDGISLAGDTNPGAYFQHFQRVVVDLQERGVAIALCSKNNDEDVFNVLDSHPAAVLRRKHLSAWRIDWNDKPGSIVAIAKELNIGTDAIVFVDDSPMECELVKSALPDVQVLQAPTSPEALVGFLERQHLFDALVITDTDRDRTRSYQQSRARREFAEETGDFSEYKRRLGSRLGVREARDSDRSRIAQLSQRTNQFNLTTRRHNESDIEALLANPRAKIAVAELSDRFGDMGVIGCVILVREADHVRIDTMLMSCRALGRDAELAFAVAAYRLAARYWPEFPLRAEYLPTSKNSVAAGFWARAGLNALDESKSRIVYASGPDLLLRTSAIVPAHVTLVELDERETEAAGGRNTGNPGGQH